MKVLWISDFRSANVSGATSQAVLCGKALKDAGVDVTFCQVPPLDIRGKKFVESDVEGVRVLYPVGNMMNTIREVDPDVIMLHCYSDSLLPELDEIVRGYPVIVRVGINVLELLVTPKYPPKIAKIISFLQKADYIVAASENTKDVVESLGCRPQDISVIFTAINPEDFEIADCRDPTISILGRVFPVKNHLTLIQAVNLVKKRFPKVELAIAGEGSLTKVYQDVLDNLLLTAHSKMTGYLDLKWLFREVSILALPSISENMPMVVLEAYASGVPCILADSGWGETFKAALKAKHDKPREWADLLYRLLTDRVFYEEIREKQLGELTRFTIQTIVPKYVKLFRKAVKLKRYKIKSQNPRRN